MRFRFSAVLALVVLSGCGPISIATISVEDDASNPVVGSLRQEAIRKVIQANRNRIRPCYESLFDRFPTLEGEVAIRFIVSAQGSVSQSSVASSTANNAELEACVAERVKRLNFPKPEGGGIVIVTYPFIFEPSPSPPTCPEASASCKASGLGLRGTGIDVDDQPTGVREPEVLREVKVPYPEQARINEIEGSVRLKVTIDSQGAVQEVTVLCGPAYVLRKAARDALRRFRFKPGTKGGKAVSYTFIYTYTFCLDPPEGEVREGHLAPARDQASPPGTRTSNGGYG